MINNLLRKVIVPVSAVAVIALTITLVAPRAVRASVAALVSVTNTVPVLIAPSAPQLYESNCAGFFPGPSFEGTCDFQAAPAGNTLFIDAVSIYLNSVTGGFAPQWVMVRTYNTGASYPEGQATQGGAPYNALFVPLTKTAPGFGDNFVGTLVNVSVWTANSPGPKCDVLLNGLPSPTYAQFSCTIWGHLAPIPGGGGS